LFVCDVPYWFWLSLGFLILISVVDDGVLCQVCCRWPFVYDGVEVDVF